MRLFANQNRSAMNHYSDLPTAINELRKQGYTLDFSSGYDCIICGEKKRKFSPEEFQIDEVYRFEADSDPENQSVLYAISSVSGEKGLMVNAYGIYADSLSNDMIAKLSIHH